MMRKGALNEEDHDMALTREEMLKIVDNLYAATSMGDFDAAEALLTDDFFITEADSLPMAGVYRGKTALRDLFTQVMGMMDVAGLARGETTTGGDFAVCHVTFQFQDTTLQPAELLELFRFKGGKICEIRPYYFDPSQIVEACKAKSA
jgi:ketosteroid isomerase-like protein